MTWAILFLVGLAVGSFLNVLTLRYDPDRFMLSPAVVGGRSHCPKCGRTLRWFELIPLLSFAVQMGKCRSCGARLSLQYPAVELLTGIIFAVVPFQIQSFFYFTSSAQYWALTAAWTSAFAALIALSVIDMRTLLIPDEANAFLILMGVAVAALTPSVFSVRGSFLGSYALLFNTSQNLWLDHLIGILVGGGFLWLLAILTRGRAMGMGDVKLAAALGFLFGWPDVVLAIAFAFIIGAAWGVALIALRRETIRGTIPFGPFLALGGALVFFWGAPILHLYFSLFNI